MPGDQARVNIVAAADGVADLEFDGLALVELGGCLGEGDRARQQNRRHRGKARENSNTGLAIAVSFHP